MAALVADLDEQPLLDGGHGGLRAAAPGLGGSRPRSSPGDPGSEIGWASASFSAALGCYAVVGGGGQRQGWGSGRHHPGDVHYVGDWPQGPVVEYLPRDVVAHKGATMRCPGLLGSSGFSGIAECRVAGRMGRFPVDPQSCCDGQTLAPLPHCVCHVSAEGVPRSDLWLLQRFSDGGRVIGRLLGSGPRAALPLRPGGAGGRYQMVLRRAGLLASRTRDGSLGRLERRTRRRMLWPTWRRIGVDRGAGPQVWARCWNRRSTRAGSSGHGPMGAGAPRGRLRRSCCPGGPGVPPPRSCCPRTS